MKDNKYKRVEKVIAERKQNGGVKSSTGYKGVKKDNRVGRKPFRATFNVTYKNSKIYIALGSYDTPEEAYIARLKFIESLK